MFVERGLETVVVERMALALEERISGRYIISGLSQQPMPRDIPIDLY